MFDHLPILQVVIPLLAAPMCILIRHRAAVSIFATVVTWVSFLISCGLLYQVSHYGVIRYDIGGWASPWGIEYRVDLLNAYVLLIVTSIGSIVLPFTPRSVGAEVSPQKRYLLYSAILLCFTGLLGITITGDLFNVFVFLEISSLSSYTLISMGRHRRALVAAYQYLIMGTIGGTFILIGVGLIYMMTGTLNMIDISERLHGQVSIDGRVIVVNQSRTILAAFAFITVGISIKLALFPLHEWLPNAYAFAPSAVTAFMASTATKVSFYLLLRMIFTIFGAEYVFGSMHLDTFLMVLALINVFVSSCVAIYQPDVKRLLAYSSLSQIGYIVLGLSFYSVTGLTAGIVHLFNHALMKGGLFMAVGCVILRIHSSQIKDWRGIGRSMPWTMAAFALGGLNLIGIPGTAGFVSKWFLVTAAIEQEQWLVAFLALLGSLLAVLYVWRVIEVAYFQESEETQRVKEAPLSMLLPTWIMIGASLVFGLVPYLPVRLARQTAEYLIGLQ